MKKKIIIIISVLIILLVIGYGSIVYTDYYKVVNGELPVFANYSDNGSYQGLGYTVEVKYYQNTDIIEEMNMKLFGKTIGGIVQCIEVQNESQEIVIIENGNIQNENKIDEFIDKANNCEASILQIHAISGEKTDNIKLEFVPGKIEEINTEETNTVNMQVPSSAATAEE